MNDVREIRGPAEAAGKARQSANARAALVAAYREGLALAAIMVIGNADTARIVAAEPGADIALAPGEAVVRRWWCRRPFHAEHVASEAAKARRRGNAKIADAASRACVSVADAATRLAVPLQSDEELSTEAMAAIARLDDEIDKQMRAGALKSVNQGYRDYRLAAAARCEKILRYAQWMERYKERLIREIAVNLRHV
jgi:hypothetical protein